MNWPFARVPATLPDGALPLTEGFDLSPWRQERARAWRRRSRAGGMLAVLAGLAGAALLHALALRQQRLDDAHHQQLERRLAALAPAVDDARRLETWIAAQEAEQARRAALEPRRRRVIALLEALGDVVQDGIALTTVDFSTDAQGRAQARLGGLADDADAVARWSRRLAAHTGIDTVALDELRLLVATAPVARAPSGAPPAPVPSTGDSSALDSSASDSSASDPLLSDSTAARSTPAGALPSPALQRFRVTVRLAAAPGAGAR